MNVKLPVHSRDLLAQMLPAFQIYVMGYNFKSQNKPFFLYCKWINHACVYVIVQDNSVSSEPCKKIVNQACTFFLGSKTVEKLRTNTRVLLINISKKHFLFVSCCKMPAMPRYVHTHIHTHIYIMKLSFLTLETGHSSLFNQMF